MKNRFFELRELIRLGNLEEAEKHIYEMLQRDPDDFYTRLLQAELFLKKGGIEKAERLCHELLKKRPTDRYVLSIKGRILLAKGTKQCANEAIEVFNYLFTQFKTTAFLYWLLEAYIKAKKYKEAWEILQSVPYSLQDNSYIRRLKARILKALKRYEDAIKVYEILLKENPKDTRIKKEILLLKRYLKGEKKWEKEIEAIGRLPSAQRDVTLLLTQAQLAKKRGKIEEAISLYQQVLKIDPENQEAPLNLAFCLVKSDDPKQVDAGIDQLKQFFLTNPYDHPVRSALFAAYKRRNRIPELLSTLQEALLRHPEKVKIYGWIKRYQKMVDGQNNE